MNGTSGKYRKTRTLLLVKAIKNTQKPITLPFLRNKNLNSPIYFFFNVGSAPSEEPKAGLELRTLRSRSEVRSRVTGSTD